MAKNTRNDQTDEDIYENTIECKEDPKSQESAERKPASSKETVKFLLVFLGLLLIGALIALCVLGFLYHSQSSSFSERFANATAELKLQELKTTEFKSRLEKVQVSYEAASKQLDSLKANKSFELCDEGWRSLGLKCYFFSTNNLNWTESRDSCVKKGGHLVIITSKAEQDFLVSQIKETHWMGLNDLEKEGKWMWVNNKTLDETGVKFWFEMNPIEPDNWSKEDTSGENCASLGDGNGNNHRWFDGSCRKVKKYICEK
ncbi:CD209 antigen-like protein E [Trichomycterus rosablanca]|uniref:CD209 antigen-like protein E n=1 Tax=Trichomycterus rosablanca TaxID=2290929 RepID=UPI002F360268